MSSKVGDQFTVNIADGTVLMEITGIRCGDVWDCNPVQNANRHVGPYYAQEYGSHMVFTDEQVTRMVTYHTS